MGFFFKRVKSGKLLFEVKGEDILYALQFHQCKWDYRVYIELPECYFKFTIGCEYFLLIVDDKIKCVWEYEEFVPLYPKKINIDLIMKTLNRLNKNKQDVDNEIKKYTERDFNIGILCKFDNAGCKSLAHPCWANILSQYVKNDMMIPKNPYLCDDCLNDPPKRKKGQLPTPVSIMKSLYG